MAANGLAGAHLSTGSPECCVCPVCRVIAAMRDPSPEFADRLAEGAADLATGVASMLRSLSGAAHHAASAAGATHDAGPGGPDGDEPVDDPWRAATSTPPTSPPPRAPMARKAVKKAAVPPRDTATAPATGQDEGDSGTEEST
ncbi:hypothetical protein GCM10009681_14020 [Luedemannella helvata]|uniref:Uncharacterized protein n=1 Tax=Luedemannella helvata TaxID=349315 RepID=A0ABN2JZ33_9ACTN